MVAESNQSLQTASRSKRIGAFLIDHITIAFLMVAIIFLSIGPDFMSDDGMGHMMTTMISVMVPGMLVYIGKDSIGGISFGKWVIGLMVRDASNPDEVPTVGILFVRNLLLVIWPIEFIVLASNADKRRLGDRIAKTIVVENPTRPKTAVMLAVCLTLGIAFFTFVFLFAGTAMKQSDAYKVAVKEIQQNEEIVKETGGIKGFGMMPMGNISISNGYGDAQLQIKVLGNDNDLDVSVHLTMESDGEWNMVKMDK
ncbi:MAG: RDD family protein [Chryseolinea sp.]